MRVDVLTLFPGIFQGYLEESLVRKARDKGILDIRLWNWRDWATGPHKTVDDRPYGGGPGMVLMCEPLYQAVEAVRAEPETPPGKLVMLTPAGERLTQARVEQLAGEERLVLLCGRYEEISVGDFICNGGEAPAMVLIDSVARLLPGFLGDPRSAEEESHSEPGILEYPHYTRPRVFRGMETPQVLLDGNHEAIRKWRRQMALDRSGRASDENDGDS
jgi:tRNA (guanine37-N1)-methyltransferase